MNKEKLTTMLASLEENMPAEINEEELIEAISVEDEKDINADYIEARHTYKELIKDSKEAIDIMMDLARDAEHPRMFEVLSGMLKNTADINDRLMELQKSKKDLKKREKTEGGSGPVNNNLFVGSTVELQKFLKQQSA